MMRREVSMKMVILVICYILIGTFGQILFKMGANKGFALGVQDGAFRLQISLISIVGLLLYVVSFCMWMFILTKFDVSYIFPIVTGMLYVSVLFFSTAILKERIDVRQLLGIAFILIGVVFMNLPKK